MNEIKSVIESIFAELHEKYTKTDVEREVWDWAAEAAIPSWQDDEGDSFYVSDLYESIEEDMCYRLGIQFQNMFLDMSPTEERYMEMKAQAKVAFRIARRL